MVKQAEPDLVAVPPPTIDLRGPRPLRTKAGKSIDAYLTDDLACLATWIMKDGLLRSVDELSHTMFEYLGYKRKTVKIKGKLDASAALHLGI